jgi:hypothetical protein
MATELLTGCKSGRKAATLPCCDLSCVDLIREATGWRKLSDGESYPIVAFVGQVARFVHDSQSGDQSPA